MQNRKPLHKKNSHSLVRSVLLLLFIFPVYFSVHAQICPANIDFENGTLDGWTCYTGNVSAGSGSNVISLTPSGPIPGRHTMLSSFPGDGNDHYGGFPMNCPNGSGHSIRLGNNLGGGEAEGISYEFTIPAGADIYSLIYHYAVVFQDPNHLAYQQPRMEIEITNVTDNTTISCSSFTFFPNGSLLPGFFVSPNPDDNTPVWCKDWTAVSINLDGNAGKTVRLFFKTADCTFRRHFGYAYIDVNSECSGEFVGATYCPGDTLIHVVAPYGYQNYTWFDNSFTQVLGTQQTLTLSPPPAAGTTVAVVLVPYNGYGCLDTLYAKLVDTLTVVANAGIDKLSCNLAPVQIGAIPKQGFVYQWSPVTGLNNPNIGNPSASPGVTTEYVLTTTHDGGGCYDTDTVIVNAAVLDNTLQVIGKTTYCIGSEDDVILRLTPTDSIQWFRDNVAITGANQTDYTVTQSGLYYARLFSNSGCQLSTANQQINVSTIPVAGFTYNNLNQCLVNNRFIFTNTSTNVLGAMQYNWDFGDGIAETTRDVTHSYAKAGTYLVKMTVSSNTICADSEEFTVTVNQNAVADFIVNPTCINLPVLVTNNTLDTINSPISYLWDFGNGQTSTLRNPPAQVYTNAGNYSVTLSVNTPQCPSPVHTIKRIAVIDKPRNAVRYSVEYAVIDYPLTLEARSFGTSAVWSPGIYLDKRTSYTPVFKGSVDQLYTIEIKTASGCITVDTQLVKAVKHADIFVPSAFTPNNDGLNDYLRPILLGIKEIRYFRIFNRWGQIMYEGKSELPGWNGLFRGVIQSTQVVVWMVEAVGVDGNIITKKGTCTLIR